MKHTGSRTGIAVRTVRVGAGVSKENRAIRRNSIGHGVSIGCGVR
jgi:hypothetical protein